MFPLGRPHPAAGAQRVSSSRDHHQAVPGHAAVHVQTAARRSTEGFPRKKAGAVFYLELGRQRCNPRDLRQSVLRSTAVRTCTVSKIFRARCNAGPFPKLDSCPAGIDEASLGGLLFHFPRGLGGETIRSPRNGLRLPLAWTETGRLRCGGSPSWGKALSEGGEKSERVIRVIPSTWESGFGPMVVDTLRLATRYYSGAA